MTTVSVRPEEAPARLPAMGSDGLRLGLLIGALAFNIIPIYQFIGSMIWFREYLGDFQVFWGIGSVPVSQIYDHRIFAYPPSALLLIRPFALLPMWLALILWSGLGLGALCLASRRSIGVRAIGIGCMTYAGVGVLLGGQISLFIAALVIAGLENATPRWKGLLLAAGAVIKPQSLIVAPIALIAELNWRAILAAIGGGVALLLLSIFAFGWSSWLRWIAELPHFHAYLVEHRIDRLDVGLYGLSRSLGLPGELFVLGIPLGIATSWLVFRRPSRVVDRYAAFATSAILMSPYTLYYDLAGLTFACVAMLLDRQRSVVVWVGAAMVISSIFATFGVVILAIALCIEATGRANSAEPAQQV